MACAKPSLTLGQPTASLGPGPCGAVAREAFPFLGGLMGRGVAWPGPAWLGLFGWLLGLSVSFASLAY